MPIFPVTQLVPALSANYPNCTSILQNEYKYVLVITLFYALGA